MKIIRVVLAAALVCPAPLAAQNTAPAPASPADKPRSAPAAAPVRSSALSPISPNPTPVALPSYSGLSSSGTLSALAGAPMCGGPEHQELEKITALNMIEQQKEAQKLRSFSDERDEAAARYNALFEKQKLELSPLEYELKRLQVESNI